MPPRITGKYKSRQDGKKTPAYLTWRGIIYRCKKGYYGASVCEEWKDFQNYAEWYYSQKHAGKDGFEIDKDLLGNGSKVYSSGNCCLLPAALNSFLSSYMRKPVSKYGKGIRKDSANYRVTVELSNRDICLGMYRSLEDAQMEYSHTKRQQLQDLVDKYSSFLGLRELRAIYCLPMQHDI